MVTPATRCGAGRLELYNKMSIDLAVAHGNAEFNDVAIDDGWDELPAQVSAAQSQLNDLAHTKGSSR